MSRNTKTYAIRRQTSDPGNSVFSISDDPASCIKNPETVISRRKILTVKIDYPLGATFRFQVNRGKAKAFTREKLVREIQKLYGKIYQNEDEYGVWGHAMEDLSLGGVSVSPSGVVSLSVGS